MSNATNQQNIRPIYNCERLVITPMTDSEKETYGTPYEFTKRLMSYDDSVQTNTTDLYGDGVIVESSVEEGPGTLVLGIHGLTDDEYAAISGAEVDSNGVVIETGEEEPPYCCVALIARIGKDKVNLRKWPKVRFQKMPENVQQKQGNKTYSTPTLTGSFVRCERLNCKRARMSQIAESTTNKDKIEAWLTNPDYLGDTLPSGT